jgi:hypothetical protein
MAEPISDRLHVHALADQHGGVAVTQVRRTLTPNAASTLLSFIEISPPLPLGENGFGIAVEQVEADTSSQTDAQSLISSLSSHSSEIGDFKRDVKCTLNGLLRFD